MLTLADLKPGETAVITHLHDNELTLKLLEMGCIPGETVTLQHIAPLGDPICVRLSGYHLLLRKREAASVELKRAQPVEEQIPELVSSLSLPPPKEGVLLVDK